jgi:5-methylthioadenosine/S-adenosylhomocysteine deaminase
MYFFPDAAAKAASELGMRTLLGITALEFPTPFASDADDYIDKGLAVREQWVSDPLIGFCLAPHAPYTVSDNSFSRILTLSEQLNLPIHCHIHETQQEIADSLKQYGVRPLERLHQLGILGPNFIGVHAVHLETDEIELLANTGSNVAHCPTSNLKLASGFSPVAQMRQTGVNIGLGTDGAASNNRLDMFGEMRLATLLAKGLSGDASALPANEILRMATLDAANALGIAQETGSIAVGKAADLCAVGLGELESRPCFDPVSHLINVASRENVTHVWVAGKCCVDNKTLLSDNQNDLESALALWQNTLEFCQQP